MATVNRAPYIQRGLAQPIPSGSADTTASNEYAILSVYVASGTAAVQLNAQVIGVATGAVQTIYVPPGVVFNVVGTASGTWTYTVFRNQ